MSDTDYLTDLVKACIRRSALNEVLFAIQVFIWQDHACTRY